ncbi:MAG: beta-N-acetylhexosaminidase [Halothiobacillaceae bacterium]
MPLGPLMVDVEGFTLDATERERLLHPAVGGVILFARNHEDPAQLSALVSEIHALRRPRLLVAVDQEGGRVQRFKRGWSRLPAPGDIGALFDRNRQAGLEAARDAGWLMAAELHTAGVDFSFAPVLDLNRKISGVIGDRAFHEQPDGVIALATAFVHGMKEAGMQAVGKHFPGHGSVAEDSHVAHPVDRRPAVDIEMEDMRCFAGMVEREIAGIMAAHVVYPSVDELPAGFSRRWIGQGLRTRLNFGGAVFTDDLSMEAAAVVGDYPQRLAAALDAGCDMALICNHPEAVDAVLASCTPRADPLREVRLARFHVRSSAPDRQALRAAPRWRAAVARLAPLVERLEPELPI